MSLMGVAPPPLTVRDILQLAMPAGTKVLAGSEGLGREVRWVRVFRSIAPALGIESPNELVLLSLEASQALGRGQSLASILHELHGLKVSAVVALGETTPADRATAELLVLPLLGLPPGASLREIAQHAISLLSRQYLVWEERVSQVCQEIARLANEEKGLGAILELLADRLVKIVAIQDEDLRLYSYAISSQFPLSREEGKKLLAEMSPREVGPWWEGEVSWPVPLGVSAPIGYSRYCVKTSEGAVGYLCVLGGESTIGEFDKLLLRRAASICALEMARERAARTEGKSNVKDATS